jgi:hypothetical protein
MLIKLGRFFFKIIRSVRLRTSVFFATYARRLRVSNGLLQQTDISGTLSDHNVNRCDSNTSLFDRVCSHRNLQSVRYYDSFFFFFLPAHSGRYRRSPRKLDSSRSPLSSADRARPPTMPMPIPLNHMEVAVHKTYSRYEMGPTSHHVSFVVAGGEPRSKPVVGPVPDVEEETASAETGPATDAGFESNVEASNTGTNPQGSATGMYIRDLPVNA